MSFASLIADAIAAHDHDGTLNRQAAIDDVVPQVMADPELVEQCVSAEVSRRIKDQACKLVRSMAKADARQSSFFGLNERHVLDDADGSIKSTRALTRVEFASLISVRQRQVEADAAYLARLRRAARSTAPIWDAHPDWRFGQVEDAFARQQVAA